MANIWSSTFSVINRSYFWCLSSYKGFKNSTSRGSTKVKILIFITIFSACTIGGEESQGVVTIDSTTATTVVDEEITFVQKGSPCGELLRRYWQPVILSEELGELPKLVKILDEELVIFRDKSGQVGLLDKHCSPVSYTHLTLPTIYSV